jgi:glycosyltransferase involved in cell wall biosynthesis
MQPSPHKPDHATQIHIPGKFLYIAGSDLYNRLNQPSQHMPYCLANHLEQVDLVGYKRFYDGPQASAWARLHQGMRNILFDKINTGSEGNIRTISARRLRLPGRLDPLLQDLWLNTILYPHLRKKYLVGIVDGPESALLMLFLRKTQRVRFLIYYDIDYYPGQSPQWAKILSRRERLCCQISDAVASVSRPLSELRRSQGAKLAVTIPNGVDFNQFYMANKIRNQHPPTLLYAGSLDARWGVDLSIRAMPMLCDKIHDMRLIIAGRGPAEQELQQLAYSLGVSDRVQFAGFVPYADLPDWFAKADLGIATSREDVFRKYASPLKIVEYMAAGLPVICSGGGEAGQLIDESGAGKNIPYQPEAFSDAVEALLSSTSQLPSYRQAAINFAKGRTWEHMGELMAELISTVIEKPNRFGTHDPDPII